MADREKIRDWYQGHEIDIDTAVDRFDIMQEGAKDSPHQVAKEVDDTEIDLGPKEPENPNDPYCTC